jgi:hypothetical protein
LTDSHCRPLSGYRLKAYEGFTKRTTKRALGATRKRYAHERAMNALGAEFQNGMPNGFRNDAGAMSRLLLKLMGRFRYLHSAATCQSGYGAVCKTVYPGSIPGVASI